ncbi:MAG TPA: APC family permease [Burkholderiales bacterium]|nr:APC family permease [Burkholderiales bacterium]
MSLFGGMRKLVLGKPLDPFSAVSREHIALVAFFAWVGLGADGLSSACYGPAEAFLALGEHKHLGLYLAALTAITVFVIALAYNQVIELFPSGGGGYKVATRLLGPRAGLVSGSALIVDYVLTIAISVASGIDALFSMLPVGFGDLKVFSGLLIIGLLLMLNLRGMKESIQVLLPIFIGFIVTHVWLILYGIIDHAERMPQLIPDTLSETQGLANEFGWIFVAAFFLKAYSLGGGTYTGIEAVSNNVQSLAEPRVKTGKWTMFYMALSLAFMAGGIILLYLLWDANEVPGQTLNAVTFGAIIDSFSWESTFAKESLLSAVLIFEGGLLFVAANTGYLGGPAVLANMAADSWMPHQFRHLSNRLVTQNGVLLMGVAAAVILWVTDADVSMLVVLYSINVFLTFSLSLAGLSRYWIGNRGDMRWKRRLALSLTGFLVCGAILVVTIVEKFMEGGWATLVITGMVVALCVLIRRHYDATRAKLKKADELFAAGQHFGSVAQPPALDSEAPTAAFMVGSSRGGAMHAVLWVHRLWPGHYKNVLFLSAREVDSRSYGGAKVLEELKSRTSQDLRYYVNLSRSHGIASEAFDAYGTDAAEEMMKLCKQVREEFSNVVFFTSKLVFEREPWYIRLLHNQVAYEMQRRLQLEGMQMVILPMKV